MRLSIASRLLHRRGAIIIGLPFLVVIASGILLQVKKQVPWVQPTEQRTTQQVPMVSWEAVLASVQAQPEAGVGSWEDIDRVDVRPIDEATPAATAAPALIDTRRHLGQRRGLGRR